MKPSNCLLTVAVVLLISGCSSTQKDVVTKSYDVSSYVNETMKENTEVGSFVACLANEYTPSYMKELATDVAIVKVIDLASADMEFFSFVPSTYGTLLVNTTILGNIKEGDQVAYVKPGGIVSVTQYEANDNPESIEKRDRLREEAGLSIDKDHSYYDIAMENDIPLEAGKTYLAYFTYHEDSGKYEIIGLERGLREVNIPIASKSVSLEKLDLAKLEIKNNQTGALESLQEYIDTNLK